MKNILLPTDFSENSWNAISYALNFYEQEQCNFYLLHVNRLSNMIANESEYIQTQEDIENIYIKPAKKQLRKVLKQITSQFPKNTNHKFYTLTDYNFFVEAIRKQVDEKKIDLIVMGTKGASGIKELIIGSNTGDVIKKVQCTTLVVPENAKHNTLKEIAFPTDFSIPYGYIKTLQPLFEVLENTSSTLRILHINKKEKELNNAQQANKELLEDVFSDLKFSFHFLTNTKVENAIQCFTESRDTDMIVMVAKNLNYFQQILFHSKVEKISYHTDIPFLVLHE